MGRGVRGSSISWWREGKGQGMGQYLFGTEEDGGCRKDTHGSDGVHDPDSNGAKGGNEVVVGHRVDKTREC